MKKLFFVMLTTVFFSFFAQAQENYPLVEGKQYNTIALQDTAQHKVIEFFSFYCPHCFAFEYKYKISSKIENILPEGMEFKQYHVNFLGAQSDNLTRAWALAMVIGVDKKVKEPLFLAAQNNALHSMNDIRQIFLDNGVSAQEFDGGINSFVVTALYNKQLKLAEQFGVNGVPDVYVNGRYRINTSGLSTESTESFVQSYLATVKGLLQK